VNLNPPKPPMPPQTFVVEDPEIQQGELLRKLEQQIRAGTLRLPPLPRVALELQRLANNPNSTLEEAVRLLERDPPMAGTILRVANTAAFAAAQGITDLKRAVTRMGLLTTRDLALSAAMGQVIRSGPHLARVRAHNRHAFVVASAVQWICRPMGIDASYGFICGLLHDVGELVVLVELTAMSKLPGGTPTEMETTWLLDRLHPAAGALALDAWQLPPMTVEVARRHHAPKESSEARALLLAVHAADQADVLAQTDGDLQDVLNTLPAVFECGLGPTEVTQLAAVMKAARHDAALLGMTG
jgi:HD-like signal output (HDOD) protein